jgi:cell division septal protein FtsQ
MVKQTQRARGRRRTRSGLPVDGALAPNAPRVLRQRHTGAWLSVTALVLGVIASTVFWRLQQTSYFTVTRVIVSGTSRLDPLKVAEASGVMDRPIYEINPAAVDRTLSASPLIQSVHVHRIWPHTVQIALQEWQPWGTWQIGGVNYLVDQQGVVLDVVNEPIGTTIYDLDAAEALQPGDRVDGDVLQAAGVLTTALPAEFSQQVSKLQYSADSGLQVITNRGVQARFGSGKDLNYKLAVWSAVDQKVGTANVHFIDLRFLDSPYYR